MVDKDHLVLVGLPPGGPGLVAFFAVVVPFCARDRGEQPRATRLCRSILAAGARSDLH